jgi:drug/metabolite transporter (DMT)-like permease
MKLGERGVALLPMLAWCMGYGALGLLLAALAGGEGLAFGRSAAWWASLLYLSLFGTVIAFFVYFRLMQRVGPGAAALTSVLIPVIALGVSAALEGWRPTPLSWAGIALCLASVGWATRGG